jgi:hypothetical protein
MTEQADASDELVPCTSQDGLAPVQLPAIVGRDWFPVRAVASDAADLADTERLANLEKRG